jgi:putative ABC transport system substrate-binding protein
MTTRRQLLTTIGAGVLVAPMLSRAQAKPYRVGFLSSESPSETREMARLSTFRNALRDRGYVEGRNLVIETRYAQGRYDELSRLATELVSLKVDVLVVSGTKPLMAAMSVTTTVPIVMGSSGDAVNTGASAQLARPTANVTGWTFFGAELASKLVELIKEAAPRTLRLAYVVNPAESSYALGATRDAASSLNLALSLFEVRTPAELHGTFDRMVATKCDAVMVQSGSMFAVHAKTIAELALASRLPSGSQLYEYAELGGLITYGPDRLEGYRKAAEFVDKLLRGAKVADLPIEQASQFELVVNTTTAKALGLRIPQSLQSRARLV